ANAPELRKPIARRDVYRMVMRSTKVGGSLDTLTPTRCVTPTSPMPPTPASRGATHRSWPGVPIHARPEHHDRVRGNLKPQLTRRPHPPYTTLPEDVDLLESLAA